RTLYKTITPRYIHNTSPTDLYNNNDVKSTVVKSNANNNDDYYYLLSSHSSGGYNRTTNRSSQTDIVDLSPEAEETHDLRSAREKEFDYNNRYTWQRSTSCKELNSARRKRAQELDSATYVTNPKELNILSEKHIDSPITRYDETSKAPYQPISIKTPSLERSDTVPETKVYSSSYPGTTSSLSTESGDQEGGLEVGGSVLIMDIGSHENLFLSHDDVSHDSYELLEREREYQEMFGRGSHSGSYGSVENLQDDADIFQMDDLLSKSTNSIYDDVRSEIDSRIGFQPSMGFNEFNELCKENFRKSHEKIYREQLSVYSRNRSNEFREINVKVKPGEVISGFSSESTGTSPSIHPAVERTKSDPYMAHEKSKPSPPSSISSKTNVSQLSLADSDTFKCHSATDIPYTLRKRADMNGTCSKQKAKPLLKSNLNLKDSGLSLSGNLGSIEDNDTTLNMSSFESRSPQDFGSICNDNCLLDRNYLSIDEPHHQIVKVKSVDSGTTKPAKSIHKIHQSRSAEGIKHKNSSFEKQDTAGNKIKVIKIDSEKCSCDSRKNSTESADAADVIIVEYRDTRRKKFGKKGSSSDNQEGRSRGSSVESKDPKLSPSRTAKGSLSKSSSPNKLSPNKTKPSSSPKDQLSPKALSPKQSPKQLSPKQTSPNQSSSDLKLSPSTCKIVKANLKINTLSPKSTPKTSPKTSPKLSPEVEIVPARKRPSDKPAIKPKPKVIPKKSASAGKDVAKAAETENKNLPKEKLKISEETVEGIKKNLLSPESPWKKFSDVNVSGKDKPPVLFGRLGLSEGSGYSSKNEAVSPGASRRAKSLETPIVALHRLPPITSFSSKDDTLGDDDDEKFGAAKTKKDSSKATAETLREVSDKLAETQEKSASPVYGQNAKETLKELLTLVASPVDKMSPTDLSPSLTPERRQSTRQERLDSFKKLKNFSIDIWDSGEVEAITNARQAANIDFELGDDDAFIEADKTQEPKSEVLKTEEVETEPAQENIENVAVEKTVTKLPSLEDQMVPQIKPKEGLIFNYDLDNIMVENYTSEEFEPFPVLAETLSPGLKNEDDPKVSLDDGTSEGTQEVEVLPTLQDVEVAQVVVDHAEKAVLEEPEKGKSKKNSLEEEEVWVSVDEYLEDDKEKSFGGYQDDKDDDVTLKTSEEVEEVEETQKLTEVEVEITPASEAHEASESSETKDMKEDLKVDDLEVNQTNADVNQIFDELPSVEEDSVFDAPDAPPPPPAIDYIISETPENLPSATEPSTSNLPVPAIPQKRSFDDEPSTSSSGVRVGESSTWRPFPLESSGSSSLEEGLFPPDDTGHYADEEGEDGSSKDDDFPTNFNYPITSAEIMLSGGFGGGVFGLSRTLSRISERSTTSEQDRSDFEDEISTKQSSHSISEDDDSILSSDRPPSVSTGSASGSQADLGYDDFPPLPDLPEEKSPDDESLETIKIPPPFIPSNSEENWPSPPASPPVATPVTSQVETFYIKAEEAAKVSIKVKQEEGEDSSTEENKTLQEEDMPPSVFSDSFTLVEEKPEPPRKKRNSDDTSIGFTTSDWSSSTGTTVKQHFGIAKSDDSSLAGDFGLSLSTEMLASGSKCSSRKSSDDTTPVLHVYYPLKQRSFDDYDSPYTTESDDTVSLSVAKPSPQKTFQQYYSAFNISPTKSQSKFLPKDRRNRGLGNKSPNSSRTQLDCPPTLEEIELSFERSKAKSIARAKCYSYYSLARSPPSDASSSSLELPESLTTPNTIPRVSKRRKTHPVKKRQRIIMTEIDIDQPDAPIQSPKSYCTATLRKSAPGPSHSKPPQEK
ncbi:uncharacterized protein, partial [Bemisia tabaci]|uniref:uncharacterized protein n=1 Tax=Bemisia tabaci TaxID=7038 RepID=UPI003B283505